MNATAPLTHIEAYCDYALRLVKLRAMHMADADRDPIARRSNLYKAAFYARRIVDSAILVEMWARRDLDARP